MNTISELFGVKQLFKQNHWEVLVFHICENPRQCPSRTIPLPDNDPSWTMHLPDNSPPRQCPLPDNALHFSHLIYGNFPGWKNGGKRIVCGGKRWEGNCHRKKKTGGELSGWKKRGGELSRWGGKRQEGNCLGGKKTGGDLSVVA